jgi:hypothetical protein
VDPPLLSALGRHRIGTAAMSGQPLEDSAADASPPPPGDRQARRSTGSVKFECDGEDAAPDDPEHASQPGGRSEASSWGDSEECFGTLITTRSVGSR